MSLVVCDETIMSADQAVMVRALNLCTDEELYSFCKFASIPTHPFLSKVMLVNLVMQYRAHGVTFEMIYDWCFMMFWGTKERLRILCSL